MASHRRRKPLRLTGRPERVEGMQLASLWVSIALLVVAVVTLLVMVLVWRLPVSQQVIVRVESPCAAPTAAPKPTSSHGGLMSSPVPGAVPVAQFANRK